MFNWPVHFYNKFKYRRVLAIMKNRVHLHSSNQSDFFVLDMPRTLTKGRMVSVSTTNRFIYLRVGIDTTAEYYRVALPNAVREVVQRQRRAKMKRRHRTAHACDYLAVSLKNPTLVQGLVGCSSAA